MGDKWDIARKEMRDIFSSRRFLMVLGLFIVLSLASVYLGIQSYQTQMERYAGGGNTYGPAPEKPDLIDVFVPLFSFNMPLTAGILGLLLSYDYISGEREEGTIELLLSYPVYRDEIINGKLIAGTFTVAVSILTAFSISSGLAIYMLGIVPGMETVSRLSMIWLGTVIYITFFLALGTLLSTLFKSRWRALGVGAILLLAFIGTPFLANIAAGQIYKFEPDQGAGPGPEPLPGPRGASSGGVSVSAGSSEEVTTQPSTGTGQSYEERRAEIEAKREKFRSTVSRISPSTSYSNFVGTMSGTSYQSGEEGLEPTFAESFSSSIGYLIYLVSQLFMVLTAAYGVFLRQDL